MGKFVEKRVKLVEITLVVALAFGFTWIIPEKPAMASGSSAEIVLEQTSLRVLFARNEHLRLPNASTTKIVTAITVIEHTENLDRVVAVPKVAVGTEGSSIYLTEGEKLTVRDLLCGLMLRSGNDAAVALAVVTAGNVWNFSVLMNNLAAKLGLKDSHFVNPHGLHDDNHYTSAYDLAVITAYAMKNEDFRSIVSAKSATIPGADGEGRRYLKNKNKMLSLLDGADGVKTGYTKKAGRCLVTSAKRENMRLISVVLNVSDMWNESAKMLENCFSKYKMKSLYFAEENAYWLKTEKGGRVLCMPKNSPEFPLTESEAATVRLDAKFNDVIPVGVKIGETVGKLDVYAENRLIFSTVFTTMQGK